MTSPAPTLDGELRQLLLSTLATLFVLLGAAMVSAYFFRDQLFAVSQAFVERFGGPGVALGFFIPDALTVPLPNDAFSAFGLLGGLGFGEVVFWGSLGSIAGGCTGYALGRALFSRSERLRRLLARRGLDRVQRDGVWALAMAAITPLPYSVFCWGAGAVRMPPGRFVAVSLLRIPKVAGYLWLIQLGVISVT